MSPFPVSYRPTLTSLFCTQPWYQFPFYSWKHLHKARTLVLQYHRWTCKTRDLLYLTHLFWSSFFCCFALDSVSVLSHCYHLFFILNVRDQVHLEVYLGEMKFLSFLTFPLTCVLQMQTVVEELLPSRFGIRTSGAAACLIQTLCKALWAFHDLSSGNCNYLFNY